MRAIAQFLAGPPLGPLVSETKVGGGYYYAEFGRVPAAAKAEPTSEASIVTKKLRANQMLSETGQCVIVRSPNSKRPQMTKGQRETS